MKNLKWNSKRIVVAIRVIVVAALVLGLGGCIYREYRLPKSNVDITGTIVDNRYNNYISEFDTVTPTGDFVRIGDKLYFNYYGSYESYGLYEITSNGAHRIHWDGYCPWAFLTGYEIQFYPIQVYGEKLLMNTIVGRNYSVFNNDTWEWELTQGRMQTYCGKPNAFEEVMLFGGITDINALTYQETDFGYVYEASERLELWVYTEENGSVRIVAEDVLSFYTVGERIYYLVCSSPNDPLLLRMYAWDTKTDTLICTWPDYANVANFMIEDNLLIFMATHLTENTRSVYKLDLSNPLNNEEAVYATDLNNASLEYIFCFNVWDGTVYICSTDGMIAYDLDTGARRVLCDKSTETCYIVDDTWVYFVETDSPSLWRVPQSGGDVELVLG